MCDEARDRTMSKDAREVFDRHVNRNFDPGAVTTMGEGSSSSELTLDNVEDAFRYHPWDARQHDRGMQVRDALVNAAKVMLRVVPRGPARTRALEYLRDARMLANHAITPQNFCYERFAVQALSSRTHYNHPRDLPLGSIVAVCELVAVESTVTLNSAVGMTDQARAFGDYSPGRYGFVLRKIRPVTPIACRGALGLWTVPDAIAQQIREELGA